MLSRASTRNYLSIPPRCKGFFAPSRLGALGPLREQEKSRRSKRNRVIRLLMLPEKNPAVNPQHSDFNKYETYRCQCN